MSLNSIQRSRVFSTYNTLRGAGTVERGRLNRALGLAQSQEERPYETTHESCTCPDWQYRISKTGGQCKHQTALLLSTVAEQAEEPEEASREVDLDEINKDLFGW